jgi:hypothetical protein
MTVTTRNLVPLIDVPKHRPWTNVRWLRRAVYEHRLPYHKVIGKVLIDLDDIDAFAEHGRVDGPA